MELSNFMKQKVDYKAALRRREAFFNRPSTVSEIIGDRHVIDTDVSGLVHAIEECAKDRDANAILVHGPIIPNVKPVAGWEEAIEPYRLFLRYGDEVKLRVPRSIRAALEEEISPIKLRIDQFAVLDPKANYCAITWNGIRTRGKSRLHLVDAIEGMRLFAFSEHAPDVYDRIQVDPYIDTAKVEDQGGIYVVTVPSRSRPKNYLVRVESVPIPETRNERVVWTDERFDHVCEENLFDFGYRTKVQAQTFCPHDIAATLAIAKSEKKRGFMNLPAPLMKKTFVESVYNVLRSRVMVIEQGKGNRKVKRTLNKGEVERALWLQIQSYGVDSRHRQTCYVDVEEDGMIQDYNWSLR